jgi:sugar/nucleoside kinase (ribokinase family)
MRKYHVYGIGNALVDTEIEVSDEELNTMGVEKSLMTLVDAPRQAELIKFLSNHLVAASRASGGSGANSIIASSYFGGEAFYSCKVSNDPDGDFYVKDMREAGVDCNLGDDRQEGITGRCLVLITADADRSMNTYLGISESLSVAELSPAAIADSEYVYLEGYLVTSPTGRAAAIKTRELAEQHQVKTAMSFSDPGMVEFFKDGLQEMLGDGVDLVFCNEAEAKFWADTDNLDTAVDALKKVARTFAITLGAEGSLVYDGTELSKIAAHAVTAIDTNGAGDMFAGAFLYAITHGYSYREAGELASLGAAQVVAQYGPRLAAHQHVALLQAFQNQRG